jgi:hypothetical protein
VTELAYLNWIHTIIGNKTQGSVYLLLLGGRAASIEQINIWEGLQKILAEQIYCERGGSKRPSCGTNPTIIYITLSLCTYMYLDRVAASGRWPAGVRQLAPRRRAGAPCGWALQVAQGLAGFAARGQPPSRRAGVVWWVWLPASGIELGKTFFIILFY